MDLNTFLNAVVEGDSWNIHPEDMESTVTEINSLQATADRTNVLVLEEQLDEALAEATDLFDKLTASNKRAAENYDTALRNSSALRDFKISVRNAIIEAVDEGQISEDDAETLLTDTLGLDGLEREYEVEVVISQNVLIRIMARDGDAARDKVEEMDADDIIREHADEYSWEIDTTSYISEV
jgi:hypothetical protein